MITGRQLNREWKVGAQHALYRKSGDWYYQLDKFPGVLFDAEGYVLFRTKEEFVSCPCLQIQQDVHVPGGNFADANVRSQRGGELRLQFVQP